MDLLEPGRDLAERLRFIDAECDIAWELTDPERRHHLVVVQARGLPAAVACSWPLPPPHARPMETVKTGGFL